ncbi:MAG TPA: nitrogenase component 1 [Myxococcota bacterium]|nr:nitrogenase component 1 [Myxococcota bacterium]
MTRRWDLEHFRLKSQELGQLTGAAMAIHAIPDAFLLKHTGVGCKHKTVTQFGTHDWGRGLASHEGWTEVGDRSLIAGSGERLGPYARSSWQRHEPAILAVASVTFIDLAGDDLGDLTRGLDEELPSEVMLLKVPGYEGDVYSGYLATMLDVARRVDWSRGPERRTEVALLGYLWDRYEGDHQGNVQQLGALLKGIGLELGPVWLSGVPWAELQRAAGSGVLVQLPYAAPKAKALRRITKRDPVPADLPIGARATAAFLRSVGRAAGVPDERIEAFTRRQAESLGQRLGSMADRLRGMRVMVLADLPLLAGVMSLLDELGIRVEAAGIRGRSLGGRDELLAALARVGAAPPDGCEILVDPSVHLVRETARRLLRERRLDGVLGSATDHNALSTLPATEVLAPLAGEQLYGAGPLRLEIGFPCREHHCTFAMPFMGYGGVVMWVQRLLSAPRLWDAGRQARV